MLFKKVIILLIEFDMLLIALPYLGIIFLLLVEILSIYFIMPFPGSQHINSISLSYFIHSHIYLLRIAGILILIFGLYILFTGSHGLIHKVIIGLLCIIYICFTFIIHNSMSADKMFLQPNTIEFTDISNSLLESNDIVLGTTINGESKAYPLEYVGYHHQIRDVIGGVPVMITYCTVCRTGRIWSPIVNGTLEEFRLVGMDQFNAMFEDKTTGSWWRQVNGEAVAGSMKGTKLSEFPISQMSFSAWKDKFPQSKIMLPDLSFQKEYQHLKGYAQGTLQSTLIGKNPNKWQNKSWIIGITLNNLSKAYDWSDLLKNRIIIDTIGSSTIILSVLSDNSTFLVFSTLIDKQQLHFIKSADGFLIDSETNSKWDAKGNCIEGTYQGKQLYHIQGYQEFWHSWKTFHPETEKYN